MRRKSKSPFLLLVVLMFIVIANVFLLIFFVPAEQKSVADNQEVDFKHINAIILPHHLLVEKLMDEFYANVAKENQYERIILISPNHFGYGYGLIQTTDQLDDISVDQALATSLGEDKAAFVEGGYFDLEHGLHSHYDFIKNHFGDTPIVPILLKNEGTQERLDQLVGSLAKNDLQNTLIIASIDFSHGTPEAVALANDQRIFDWLENWNAGQSNDTSFDEIQMLAQSTQNPEETVAMDSPETFYVMIRLIEKQGKYDYQLWERTSSASLINPSLVQDNVSHLFAVF